MNSNPYVLRGFIDSHKDALAKDGSHMPERWRRNMRRLIGRAESELESPKITSLGDWAQRLVRAASGFNDSRLVRAPIGAGEVDPTGGGYLVPTAFQDELVQSIYSEAVLAPLTDRQTVDTGRPVKRPAIDETSRAEGARQGNIKVFWSDESSSITAGFPKLKMLEAQPHSLLGYVNVSNELLNDAPTLGAHLTEIFAAEFSFKLDQAILVGTGAGQPLGVVNSSSAIVVAAEVGQTPATIVKDNIDKMWSRLAAPSRKRCVWVTNEDGMAQLDAANAVAPWQGLFAPPSNGERFPRLKGAPVLEVEAAPALGKVGDIALLDLSQYWLVENHTAAISGDVLFLSDQTVFRFKVRVGGLPKWSSPITPFNGTSTRSPFVTLAAR